MTARVTLPPLSDSPATPDELHPGRLAEANINPETGLATDYLNHFNEAIMLLEMLPEFPDCIEDLMVWRPVSYREHFAASSFKERDLAIAAYEMTQPQMRQRLDDLADVMNAILVSTGEAMQRSPSTHATAAREALTLLKPLVAQAGALINGAEAAAVASAETGATQAAIDALLER